MFILTKIQDLVQIDPRDLHEKPANQCIEDDINKKYSNKIIQKIGLCICLYDLLEASDGQIGNGSGLVSVNVTFRLLVFRPFKGEVLLGRISACTPDGIALKTHFFSEIFVPAKYLPSPSHYDQAQGVWVWDCDGSELYYDLQESVRFRVEGEEWVDSQPRGPSKDDDGDDADEERVSPYLIEAGMEDPGLGPCLWWDGEAEEGDEE